MTTSKEQISAERGHRWFAAIYDRMNASMERGPLAKRRADLLVGLRGDVLEIGAGTGANFPHYPEEARVVAVEPDPHMAQRAEPRLRPNIRLERAPGERLPFGDASFDAAVTTLVLCSVDDAAGTLREIRRVLRPGGELRFYEHVRAHGLRGMAFRIAQPLYGRMSGGCHLMRDTEQAMRDAGYTIELIEHGRMRGLPTIGGVAKAPGGAG